MQLVDEIDAREEGIVLPEAKPRTDKAGTRNFIAYMVTGKDAGNLRKMSAQLQMKESLKFAERMT